MEKELQTVKAARAALESTIKNNKKKLQEQYNNVQVEKDKNIVLDGMSYQDVERSFRFVLPSRVL